jgi:uncharacterized membrane protein YcaP (DUF421 family)
MESVLKAVAIYLALWLLIRLSGRRALGQLSVFEFVLFLIIGGAAQRALTGEDYSLTNAFIIVATLVGINVLVSLIAREWPLARKIFKGVPMILVENGRPLTGRIRRSRLTEDEIMESARRDHGIETMAQVKYAILETSGHISIVPQERPRHSRKKPPAAARENGSLTPRRETPGAGAGAK